MTGSVVVVGSFAVGLTLRAARFPVPGQTVLARDFDQGPGGKGSNQAIQAARMGAAVDLVGLVGQDGFAELAREVLREEGVGVGHLAATRERNTGVGFIVLDEHGENVIVLDPGANALLSPEHVAAAGALVAGADVVLAQLEVPVAAAQAAMDAGRAAGATTVLNPAPGRRLPAGLLARVDVLTPNQTEARMLLGLEPDDPVADREACEALLGLGAGAVLMTQGRAGALLVTPEGATPVPGSEVATVDTTGAGDAFTGTLAARLAAGDDLGQAAQLAAGAGALACTRLGVVPALPTAAALERFLARRATPTGPSAGGAPHA